MRHAEHRIQVAAFEYFSLAYTRSRGWLFLAIPMGGRRNSVTGAYLKAEGATAGTPDVVLVLDRGRTVWVEFKAKGGRVSPSQVAMAQSLKDKGHTYWLVWSLDDFVKLCRTLEK